MILDTKILIGIVTVILTIIGYIPYIRDIFRGKTKPHLYSWLLWGIFGLIIFSIQVQGNAGAGAWMTGLLGIVCLFITGLSLKYGTKNITHVDHLFLGGAIISILLWVFIEDPTLSLVCMCIIDALGFSPTIRKSWYHPYEETIFLYQTAAIRYGLSLIAITTYTIDTVLYPALWFVINITFNIYLLIRRSALDLKK